MSWPTLFSELADSALSVGRLSTPRSCGWVRGGFYQVQHLDGGLDGSLRVVGSEATGTECLALVLPRDDRLYEGIRATSWRDGDGVVGQHWESAAECLLVDFSEGGDEGIVLSVTAGVLFVFLAVDFYLYGSHGLESVGQVHEIALQPHTVFADVVFQNVAYNIR